MVCLSPSVELTAPQPYDSRRHGGTVGNRATPLYFPFKPVSV